MNTIVEKIVQPVVSRSMRIAAAGVKNTRRMAETSSDWINSSTNGVSYVSNKALKLNKISHATLSQLVSEQAEMVEGTLEAAAKRLDVAANADSIKDLWSDQMELVPASRKRLAKDAKKVIGIFANTRDQLTELVAETVADVSNRGEKINARVVKAQKSVTKKARKKATAVKKSAKKTAKKVSGAKKRTSKKKTARKTAKKRS